MEQKSYELILIVDPILGEEKTNAILSKIEEKIKGGGGEVVKVDKWGERKFSSLFKKAKKATQGYYIFVRFKSPTKLIAELRGYLKVTESVLRYFISLEVANPRQNEERIEGTPLELSEVKPVGEGERVGQS